MAPPARTSDVSDAPAATLPDELDQTFPHGPMPGQAAAKRTRIGALMTGRGLVATTLLTDAAMLLLPVGAAVIGARATHTPSGGSWIVCLSPPLVIGFL